MIELLAEGNARCCGCGTCVIVCPVKAISLKPQELGCLYPFVDAEKCIDCHLCKQNCAFQIDRKPTTENQQAFVAVATDKAMLRSSASGGIFAAVAKSFLEADGMVCGCSMEMVNGKLTPMHVYVDRVKDLPKLQGSKYVQSALGNVFLEIKSTLLQGKSVLFSGTPCQVDSLKHYVREIDTSKLFTIDIICHGVPSSKLFQDYIDGLSSNRMVISFQFRDKTYGWGLNAKYSYVGKDGKERTRILPPGLSSYYTYFLGAEIYRESCYSCKYANTVRVGDLTIGDFWGFEEEYPQRLAENGGAYRVYEGISSVLVNNSKGARFLSLYGRALRKDEVDIQRMVRWNRQLREASSCSDTRDSLVEAYEVRGYKGVEAIFRNKLGIRYYVRQVKSLLRKEIRILTEA